MILFDIINVLSNKITPISLYLISLFLIIIFEKEVIPTQHCSIKQLFIFDNLTLLSNTTPKPYLISVYFKFVLPQEHTKIKPFHPQFPIVTLFFCSPITKKFPYTIIELLPIYLLYSIE